MSRRVATASMDGTGSPTSVCGIYAFDESNEAVAKARRRMPGKEVVPAFEMQHNGRDPLVSEFRSTITPPQLKTVVRKPGEIATILVQAPRS